MDDRIRRLYEMFQRVTVFLTANADEFNDIPFVAVTVGKLQPLTNQLGALGADKVTMTAAAKDSTLSRGDARDSLRGLLEYIAEIWRVSYDEAGGAANKYRVPAGTNDQNLIAAGKAFAAAFGADQTIFLEHGAPAATAADIQSKTDAFERAVTAAETAYGERVGANAGFSEPARAAKILVEKLAPTVKRRYRDDPRKLAEWLIASHVEKPSKRPASPLKP